jgi:amino acid permease
MLVLFSEIYIVVCVQSSAFPATQRVFVLVSVCSVENPTIYISILTSAFLSPPCSAHSHRSLSQSALSYRSLLYPALLYPTLTCPLLHLTTPHYTTPQEEVRRTPSSEDYYPRIAVSSLMKILRDSSLSVHHSSVTQAIM